MKTQRLRCRFSPHFLSSLWLHQHIAHWSVVSCWVERTKLRRHTVTANYARAQTGQPLNDGHNMHLPLKLTEEFNLLRVSHGSSEQLFSTPLWPTVDNVFQGPRGSCQEEDTLSAALLADHVGGFKIQDSKHTTTNHSLRVCNALYPLNTI